VFVALVMRMRDIVICGLSGSTTFSTLSHKRHDFWEKIVSEQKNVCFHFFYNVFVWNISHAKKKWARYDDKSALVFMSSTRYSCPILMELEIPWQIFEKYYKI